MSLPKTLLVAALFVALPHASRAAVSKEEAPPSLDAAVARAKASHRPLVVEFSTVWCGPCRVLARDVLPHRRVKAALAQVTFVQYDAEREPGRAAAMALRVGGFPTLVAVDAEGHALERVVGLLSPEALSAWLRSAAEKGRVRSSVRATTKTPSRSSSERGLEIRTRRPPSPALPRAASPAGAPA